MWGAVIGDIIGSSFESENHRSPYFELFKTGSRFTDDTVCTAAVADILEKNWPNLTSDIISKELRLWCCTYLNRGFGSMFYQWVANGVNKPYGSYGNGALMRISPVAKFAIQKNLTKEQTLKLGELITAVTHNHPQALNAVNMYLSLLYDFLIYEKTYGKKVSLDKAKEDILQAFIDYNIDSPKTIEEYRINLDFDLTCNTSIGIACAAILETNNFEDIMYQVVSAGGDSDTYAAIAGALGETLYEIPSNFFNKIKPFFKTYDEDIIVAIERLYK